MIATPTRVLRFGTPEFYTLVVVLYQGLLLHGYDIDEFFFKICTTSGQISELNCDHINRDFSDFLFSVDRLAFPLLFKKGILNKSFIVLVQDQIFKGCLKKVKIFRVFPWIWLKNANFQKLVSEKVIDIFELLKFLLVDIKHIYQKNQETAQYY